MSKKSDVVAEEILGSEIAPIEEGIIEEEIVVVTDASEILPSVELVFDLPVAQFWLAYSYPRLHKACASVLFTPVGLDPELMNFALFLASQSVLPGGSLWVKMEVYPEGEIAGFVEGIGNPNFRLFVCEGELIDG